LCATGLTWINVAAIPSAVRPRYIGERFLEGNVVGVDAIADAIVETGTRKDAAESSKHDIADIV
jgi:hypothetical protein